MNFKSFISVTLAITSFSLFAQQLPFFQLSPGRHSGFGEFSSVDDFESLSALKRKCARKVETQALPCVPGSKGTVYEVEQLSNELEKEFSRVLLRNYGAKILQSEVKLSCGQNLYPFSCPSKVMPEISDSAAALEVAQKKAVELPKYDDIRQNAMSLQNAIGASILAARASLTPDDLSSKTYNDRLKLQYPYLFKPNTQGFKEVLDILSVEVMTIETPTLKEGDMFLHANTMQEVMSTLDQNPELKARMQGKLQSLLTKYGETVKEELNPAKKFCSLDLPELVKRYPQVVNQLIIDLTPAQRGLIGDTLCSVKEYYDPSTYDTDCDGYVDDKDANPNNPFAPTNSFKLTKFIDENPPFSNDANYTLKKEANKVTVSLPLKLNMEGTMTPQEKTAFTQKFNACLNTDLKTQLKTAFEAFSKERPLAFPQGTEIDFKFITTNPSSDAKGFEVHKCWCSTCNLTYEFNGQVKDVPKSLCLANVVSGKVPTGSKMPAAEMAAIKKAYDQNVASGGTGWWLQEDAGNLTAGTDCGTVKHEVMHKLGLPDEYLADYYPFARVGSTQSLMNDPSTTVLPRHLARILSPSAGQNFCSL